MIGGRDIRRNISEAGESGERTPRLHRARARVGNVEGVVTLNMGSLVADILRVEDHGLRNLLLHAEVPVLIVAHAHVRILGPQSDGRVRRAQRSAEIKIGQCAVRSDAAVVQRAIAQIEGRHVEVHASVRVLALIKNTVASTNHRGLAEGPPGQAEPGRPLLVVRVCDGVRKPGFAAGLDQAFQIAVRRGRRRLRA